jgi:GDP-L-fucose synthase
MPTNPYGLDDNSHTVISNVIPALIRPFHEAKIRKLPLVTISGIRKGKESVAFVDNMTDACVFVRNGGVVNY